MLLSRVLKTRLNALALMSLVLFIASLGRATLPQNMPANEMPAEMKDIGITEKLGGGIPLSTMVKDEMGHQVPLSSFYQHDRPVIFSLVYFSCPGLCNYHLNGLMEGLNKVDWTAGQKYDLVAMSFDAKETPLMAADKKASFMKIYNRPGSENGFHFVTAEPETIKTIAGSVGFKYRWNEEQKAWDHASAAILTTPTGKIARYLHGIMFEPKDMKLGLNEAGDGKIGTFIDQMIWYCFHYDPKNSKYVLIASRVMQVGGALMILVLGILLIPTWKRARRRQA